MQEDFDLESVLSIITGINCTDDFYKVYELMWFMFEDQAIDNDKIIFLRNIAKNHILNIHPELKRVKIDTNIPLDYWIKKQKFIYGNTLTISVVGEPIIRLEKKSYTSMR